jgi:hypothetical protein
VVKKDALQNKRKALKSMLASIMEASERQKNGKNLSVQLIRKYLRLENPEVIETAYQDGRYHPELSVFYGTTVSNLSRIVGKEHGPTGIAELQAGRGSQSTR